MSRLLGIICADSSPFDKCLLSAPRSLPSLSNAQPDGWGAAVFDDSARDWRMETRALRSGGEETLASIAPRLRGVVLIAHIRERTETGTSVTAQPVRRGKWVFALDGGIEKRDYLLAGTSPARLSECAGATDCELLFAYVLTQLDRGDATERSGTSHVDAIVNAAVAELVEHQVGAVSFLLSDGVVMYAHRSGRSLCFLEDRHPTHAVTVASEALTDESWCSVDTGTLLRCERAARIEATFLRGSDPRRPRKSDIELPFTD